MKPAPVWILILGCMQRSSKTDLFSKETIFTFHTVIEWNRQCHHKRYLFDGYEVGWYDVWHVLFNGKIWEDLCLFYYSRIKQIRHEFFNEHLFSENVLTINLSSLDHQKHKVSHLLKQIIVEGFNVKKFFDKTKQFKHIEPVNHYVPVFGLFDEIEEEERAQKALELRKNIPDLSMFDPREVKKQLKVQTQFPHGMEYHVVWDNSKFISASISEVEHTIFEAVICVILVIFLFLGSFNRNFYRMQMPLLPELRLIILLI